MDKPPLPTGFFDPFPRVPVDTSDGSPFAQIRSTGLAAAMDWLLGEDGPYKKPGMTAAGVARMQVNEALLHLMELGFIDIDEERMAEAKGWPTRRLKPGEEE